MSYVDDGMVPVFDVNLQICVGKLAHASGILVFTCKTFLLVCNMKLGKTQPLLYLRGANSKGTAQEIQNNNNRIKFYTNSSGDSDHLIVAPHYRHVGGRTTPERGHLPEVKIRVADTLGGIPAPS